MIVAIASSPRFARKGERRSWSWAVELLGYIAAAVLCVILLMDYFVIAVLVHITIVGIQAAWPLKFAPDYLATYGPARIAWFFDVTTAGVVSVLVSCGLLRLLSLRWWQGRTTKDLPGRTTRRKPDDHDPAGRQDRPGRGARNYPRIRGQYPDARATPASPRCRACAAAGKRCCPPLVGAASGRLRRCERALAPRRRPILSRTPHPGIPAGGRHAGTVGCVRHWTLLAWEWSCFRWTGFGLVLDYDPHGCLSLALISLAVQSMFSGRRNAPTSLRLSRPRLAPGLFLLIWLALLTIVVFGVPILAAWGFALWFHLP